MYPVQLTESYFPAQPGKALLRVSIGDALRTAALDAGDAIALVAYRHDGARVRQWTYAELLHDAQSLARGLAAKYAKGTQIAVCAPNIPEWVILEYAAALAGLVLVTINPSFQAQEMGYVIRQSGAVALFHVQSCRGNPIADIARTVQAAQPTLQTLVDMQDADAILELSRTQAALPAVAEGDAAQIQYTSGTTGFPKGAVLTHRGLLNNALLTGERLAMDADSRYLSMMPMFHTAGCGLGTLMPLCVKGRVILVEQFAPALVNDIIEREQVTCLLGVPTMLVGMLEQLKYTPRRHASVRSLIAGGAMVPRSLVTQAMRQWGCPVQVGYGQTETSPVVTQTFRSDALDDLCDTIGRPLPHTEVAILDPASNAIQPLHAIGEICARGYLLMREYNDDPAATQAAIDADGWLHTGDLGTMDERGYVRITGRLKEMIIRGGENLFPAEIENAMLAHAAIAEVAVVGVPDEKWGEVVACFVRWEEGAAPLSHLQLASHAFAYLSPQKKPQHWIAVAEWPLTGSGKIQKFRLRQQFEAGEFAHLQIKGSE